MGGMMGGKGDTGSSQQVTKIELPEWVNQASQSNYKQAQKVAGREYTPYTGETVAGLSPEYYAAQGHARAAQRLRPELRQRHRHLQPQHQLRRPRRHRRARRGGPAQGHRPESVPEPVDQERRGLRHRQRRALGHPGAEHDPLRGRQGQGLRRLAAGDPAGRAAGARRRAASATCRPTCARPATTPPRRRRCRTSPTSSRPTPRPATGRWTRSA